MCSTNRSSSCAPPEPPSFPKNIRGPARQPPPAVGRLVRAAPRTRPECHTGGVLPTLAEILEMPTVARGRPEVVAARKALDNQVRWVHVSELEDIAELLHGGELILTTGIALP